MLVQEDNVTVYKRVGDTIFYVTGSAIENELILDSVLTAFIGTLTTLLEFVSKQVLLEYFDVVLLVVDEMIDGGYVLARSCSAFAHHFIKGDLGGRSRGSDTADSLFHEARHQQV